MATSAARRSCTASRPAGDALYPKQYDDLANALIEEARQLLGPDALQQLMKNVAARFAAPYVPRLEGRP